MNQLDEVIDLSGTAVVAGPLRIGLAPPALDSITLTPTLSQGERETGRRRRHNAVGKWHNAEGARRKAVTNVRC